MRVIILFITIIGCTLSASAKSIKIKSFNPSPFDQTASIYQKLDNNGIPCSLIKIPVSDEIAEVSFEGNIIETNNDGSEIYAYFTAGTKQIVVKISGFPPLRIVFSDYGVYRLFSKQVYNLSLSIDTASSNNTPSTPIRIHDMLDNSDSDPIDDMVEKANQLYADGKKANAIPLLEKAAELGHAEALLSLGLLYENGVKSKGKWVLKPDEQTAFTMVQNSAQQGYTPAQKVLSRYYLTGIGLSPDKKQAENWKALYNNSISDESNLSDDNKPFITVELSPEYPGGEKQLYHDLSVNLLYPNIAAENNIQGKIILTFVIEKDGSISNINILRSIKIPPYRAKADGEDANTYNHEVTYYNNCTSEAVRALEKAGIEAVKRLKKFYPGKNNGVPVRVHYTMPVNFKLQ